MHVPRHSIHVTMRGKNKHLILSYLILTDNLTTCDRSVDTVKDLQLLYCHQTSRQTSIKLGQTPV
jgi:hypothetical protein